MTRSSAVSVPFLPNVSGTEQSENAGSLQDFLADKSSRERTSGGTKTPLESDIHVEKQNPGHSRPNSGENAMNCELLR